MDDGNAVESLEKLFAAGDAWLRKYGMVTSVAHNSIVTNLYVNFPKVRYVEYFIPQDAERRKVWVVLYVPFWSLLFTNRERMADDVIALLRDYLDGYDIRVELKRYKKGVEKADEVPEDASDHLAALDEQRPDGGPGRPEPAPGAPQGGSPGKPDDPKGDPGASGA